MKLVPRQSILDFDSLFDNFWAPVRPGVESANSAFSPRVDVVNDDKHIEITAELPGVEKEDIHVTLDNGILTLSAESHEENKEEKEGKVVRQERRYGQYIRSFDLGGGIQESDINASFANGVLKLQAPKSEPSTPAPKRIEIA